MEEKTGKKLKFDAYIVFSEKLEYTIEEVEKLLEKNELVTICNQ